MNILTKITNVIQKATALVDRDFKPILTANPRLQRDPLTYTFNVKYYGGEAVEVDTLMTHVESDVESQPRYSVYFHYPFCKYVCHFCHYSVMKRPDRTNVDKDLVDSLIAHFDLLLERIPVLRARPVSSVYFGGGTPSLLAGTDLMRLSQLLRRRINEAEGAEWSVETTPDSIDERHVECIVNAGFNRVSTGIQVMDDGVLETFARGHTVDQSMKALELLTSYSQLSVNVDLMYGLPGVRTEKFLEDVLMIAGLKPHSITLYRLRLGRKEDRRTPLLKNYPQNDPAYPSQVETLIQITGARRILTEMGYVESPLGWFHLPDGECQCYRDRWLDQVPMFGMGVSAYSYGSNWQYFSKGSLREWREAVACRQIPYARGVLLNPAESELRSAAFRLRYAGEIPFSTDEPHGLVGKAVRHLIQMGLAEKVRATVRLNEIGRAFIDEIIDGVFQKSTSAVGDFR